MSHDHERFREEFRRFFWVVSAFMLATLIVILLKEAHHARAIADTDGAFPSFVCADTGDRLEARHCEEGTAQ